MDSILQSLLDHCEDLGSKSQGGGSRERTWSKLCFHRVPTDEWRVKGVVREKSPTREADSNTGRR